MFIFGQYFQNIGWYLSYNTNNYGYVSFYITGSQALEVYNLGCDTNWHTYTITYNSSNTTLKIDVDGVTVNTYNIFYCDGTFSQAAFSVGNVGFLPHYGSGSVDATDYWFSGGIDFIKITVSDSVICNYNFNEGAGQVAKDSASFYISDRTYPGDPDGEGDHLMLGFNLCPDTCDPVWITEGQNNFSTRYSSLGSGLDYYSTNPGILGCTNSKGTCLTTWNGYLINGGIFNLAGGVTANFIAKWNGTSWSALGGGLNHEPTSLTTYNNDLIATGCFDSADNSRRVNYIAKWNGTQWLSLGEGLSDVGLSLAVYRGYLIAGGFFYNAGNIPSSFIAKWDGATWSPLGAELSGPVWAMTVYNNELYAGGNFKYIGSIECNGIAKWNGSTWSSVGSGISGEDSIIYVLKVYNGELYAGGQFSKMNGVACHNIAKYNPQTGWTSPGAGLSGFRGDPDYSGGEVYGMEDYNGYLYVCGEFISADGRMCNKIAKWNSIEWCPVEYGPDLSPEDLTVYNGNLIMTGEFYSISGASFRNTASYLDSSIILGQSNNDSKANSFCLYQNYPNPFNPTTNIKYQIAKSGDVKMIIYNILGQEVATLVNENMKAGSYEVKFDGTKFSSGVYFYVLRTGSFSQTRKMLLVK